MNIDILRNVPLFASLSERELTRIAGKLVQHRYTKDSPILMESDPGNSLFILVKGRVKITRTSDAGGEVILAILKDGDFFGEISLLDGKPRTANVIAMQISTVLMLHREEFKSLIQDHPNISINLMKELASRLRSSDTQIESLSFLRTKGRVAATLLQLSETAKHLGKNAVEIYRLPVHHELAGLAGTSRESVSRALLDFEKQGYIQRRRHHLLIKDQHVFSSQYL
jgi:CRP/FNR family transcriptional regulator, cyclic AMP receptor protein